MPSNRENDTKPSATILHFPRRRGRPRSSIRGRDSGTPELVMKRLHGETMEPLDYCLEHRLITPEQHWCGIHLRWLYTLRHGVPSVRAVDPSHLGGIEMKEDDPEWRVAREKEYHDAMHKIMAAGHATLIMGICVYNERPAFMVRGATAKTRRTKDASRLISNLKDGLDVLVKFWGREIPTKRK